MTVVAKFSLILFLVEVICASGSIPPPPPPPMGVKQDMDQHRDRYPVKEKSFQSSKAEKSLQPPPPPSVPTKDEEDADEVKHTFAAPLVNKEDNYFDGSERQSNEDGAGDESDNYSEQITTRQQAEEFSKGFYNSNADHSGKNVPPPPSDVKQIHQMKSNDMRNESENVGHLKPSGGHPDLESVPQPWATVGDDRNQSDSPFRTREESTENMERRSYERISNNILGHDSNDRQNEEPEWIVPKEKQFQPQQQRLHQPPPGPPPNGPESHARGYAHTNRENQYISRPYRQRPLPGHQHHQQPQNIAPRQYNYNRQYQRGPPPGRHQHQQQYGGGALVARKPRPPPGASLFQRLGKSLETLADVETKIAEKAQQVMKTVSSGSEGVAGSVSGAMRKTVFQSIDGVTGIKEGMKDIVRGRMSNAFGGAPTRATGTRDEWEEDRRKTVTENRRKAILGSSSSDRGGPGQTFVGDGESPLEQHLYDLAKDSRSTEEDNFEKKKQEQEQQLHGSNGHEDTRTGADPMGRDEFYQDTQHGNLIDSSEDQLQSQQDVENTANPYAMLAYPVGKDLEEHDSSDIEEYQDVVDPSTFFGSAQSQSSSPPTSHPPTSFDFEEDKSSFSKKLGGLFSFPSLNLKRGSRELTDSGWSDDEDWGTSTVNRRPGTRKASPARPTPASSSGSAEDLVARYSLSSPAARKNTANLLSKKDIHQLGILGRSMAFMDVSALAFSFLAVRECFNALAGPFELQSWSLPTNLDDGAMFLQKITSTLSISDVRVSETWAPYAFLAAMLCIFNSNQLFESKAKQIIGRISKSIESNVLHSQLFLRLQTGMPIRHELMQTFKKAMHAQGVATIQIARLRAFVFATLMVIFAATVAVVKPICMYLFVAIVDFVSYEGLQEWPIDWDNLGMVTKDIFSTLLENLSVIFDNELDKIVSNPMAILTTASIVFALFAFSQLSVLERGRSTTAAAEGIQNSKMESGKEGLRETERISSLGGSSVSRLEIQMQEGAARKILNRLHRNDMDSQMLKKSLVKKLIVRKAAYLMICGLLALTPIATQVFTSLMNEDAINWRQFSGIILVLLFTCNIAKSTVFAAINSTRHLSKVAPFLQILSNTIGEAEATKRSGNNSSRAVSSAIKGLEVSDLWAAHVVKRYVTIGFFYYTHR